MGNFFDRKIRQFFLNKTYTLEICTLQCLRSITVVQDQYERFNAYIDRKKPNENSVQDTHRQTRKDKNP